MRSVVQGLLVLAVLSWSLGCTKSNSGGVGGAGGTRPAPSGMRSGNSNKVMQQPILPPPPPPPPGRGH